jgi:hypothetical protein
LPVFAVKNHTGRNACATKASYDSSIRRLPKFVLLILPAGLACGQSVEIYSEFQRPDPFGGIVSADRGLRPREILSPAVPRNGFASFHIAVSVPPKESYLLYVATNPLDACRVVVYREHFVRTPGGWIPDRLTELTRLPDFGAMPDPDDAIEGQNTRVYLLDFWIPPDTRPGRFRLEVQLKVAGWTIRPMEVRVVDARIPDLPKGEPGKAASIEQGAGAAALAALSAFLSGRSPAAGAQPVTVRDIIRRNVVQDMALAASKNVSQAEIEQRVTNLLSLNMWFHPAPSGAEWYLKIRDFLLAR